MLITDLLLRSHLLWMLSKAKHIRVLEARGTSDVYIPRVKPKPGGEAGWYSGHKLASSLGRTGPLLLHPFWRRMRCFCAFKDSELAPRLPFSGSPTLKKNSVLKKVTAQQLFYYKRFLSNHDISYLPQLLRAPTLQINDTMQV